MGKRKTTQDFIETARIVHSNKYDYSKVEYVNNRTKVCIICPEHGEFWQTPDQHLRGQGCPVCRYIKSSSKIRMGQDEFIKRSNEIHQQKYDYSKVNYKNTDTKVIMGCPIHGDFEQTPHHHLKGIGCPICGSKTYDTNEFVKRAKQTHGDKYNYSKTNYIDKRHKIIITCPLHGDFEQLPQNHLSGRGCPECGRHFGVQEKKVLKLLKEKFKNVEYQYTNTTFLKGLKKNLTLDFFLPDYNIGIEYQGIQHFIPQKVFGGENAYNIVKERDLRKYNKCKENGVTVFYISFEKQIPDDYFAPVYRTIDELIDAINKHINNQDNIKLTENELKYVIQKTIKNIIK
jgi:hypothetical protein